MSFDRLPDEVILKIFSLFSLEQLQTQLGLVNHRWKRLSEDDSHYRNLLLESDAPSSLLLKYGSCVKHLHLRERRDVNSLAQSIGKCSNLESLKLELCHGSGDNLIYSLKNCHHLNTVIMHHCECVRDVSEFLDMAASHPIRKIHLRNVQTPHNIEFWSLSNINDFRLKSVSFNYLSIGCFCHNNRDSLTTLKLIPSNEDFSMHNISLRWAEVIGSMLHDVGDSPEQRVGWMMQFIGACRNLRSLCLGPLIARELGDDVFIPLSGLHSLSTLVLFQANHISDTTFTNLFSLPMARNLTKIGLHKCLWVTSSVLRTIARHCQQLEKFTFEKCRHTQTSQDYEDILALAENCKKVKRLRLFNMDIGVAHVLHLLPQYLPDLITLEYSNDSEPMNVPSFLPLLDSKMPNFNVSGLQWKFCLHVKCKRKMECKLPNTEHDYVCAMQIKTNASYV
ncbi:hypothetical protein V9T40_011581 [Parthenolecanium corni]|uniref:F-box domain-containing protein n=1 Tax=Parthenolecanium corni TaxID=536013 RepID=A0AAN9XZP2_9HEMI